MIIIKKKTFFNYLAPFSSEDVVKTFYVTDKHYSVGASNDGVIKFASAVITLLFFNDFLLPPSAEVKDFRIKIGQVIPIRNMQFILNIYIFFVPRNEIVTDYWLQFFNNALYSQANYTTFMFNGSSGATQDFNLTELLKISRTQRYDLVKGLFIMLMPSYLTLADTVYCDSFDTKLVVIYSNSGLSFF